jgi:alpha-mannosidase
VRTDRPGLVVDTIKVAEDGHGMVVRVHETHNSRGPAILRFCRPISGAEETNLLERRLGPVSFERNELHIDVRPYGLATYRVQLEES